MTSDAATILYDAPSSRAKPMFVYGRDVPVETLVSVEGWTKIRDAAGTIGWMPAKALSDKRMVVVTAASAEAHTLPEDASPVSFVAAQNVALELVDAARTGPQLDWVHVRHADGADGFVHAAACWGD